MIYPRQASVQSSQNCRPGWQYDRGGNLSNQHRKICRILRDRCRNRHQSYCRSQCRGMYLPFQPEGCRSRQLFAVAAHFHSAAHLHAQAKGLVSSSLETNSFSSRLDICSKLMAWRSCGVIKSDCDCLISILGARTMRAAVSRVTWRSCHPGRLFGLLCC